MSLKILVKSLPNSSSSTSNLREKQAWEVQIAVWLKRFINNKRPRYIVLSLFVKSTSERPTLPFRTVNVVNLNKTIKVRIDKTIKDYNKKIFFCKLPLWHFEGLSQFVRSSVILKKFWKIFLNFFWMTTKNHYHLFASLIQLTLANRSESIVRLGVKVVRLIMVIPYESRTVARVFWRAISTNLLRYDSSTLKEKTAYS